MEKQIIIKYSNREIKTKIKTLTSYLKMFIDFNDKIICNCRLKQNQLDVFEKIKSLEYNNFVEIVKTKTSKSFGESIDYTLIVDFKNIELLLNIVEKYELNVMIVHNNVKVFLNDNDGDFIIINSKHQKYNIIKNKSN